MDMQDNEFDELFRSKLNNFEAEPSEGVWGGIAGVLGTGRRKKALMPFLSIAATILVLVAAGVLFIPKKIKTPVQNGIVKTRLPLSTKPVAKSVSIPGTLRLQVTHQLKGPTIAVNRVHKLYPFKSTKDVTAHPAINTEPILSPVKPANTDDKPVLAVAAQKPQDGIKAVVPDKETTPLTIKQSPIETTSFTTKPVLADNQPPVINKPGQAAVKTKHRIHSLGDLINVVVAKVDKRQDKIIEFTDTDDESNITGVNLGIIKLKKGK